MRGPIFTPVIVLFLVLILAPCVSLTRILIWGPVIFPKAVLRLIGWLPLWICWSPTVWWIFRIRGRYRWHAIVVVKFIPLEVYRFVILRCWPRRFSVPVFVMRVPSRRFRSPSIIVTVVHSTPFRIWTKFRPWLIVSIWSSRIVIVVIIIVGVLISITPKFIALPMLTMFVLIMITSLVFLITFTTIILIVIIIISIINAHRCRRIKRAPSTLKIGLVFLIEVMVVLPVPLLPVPRLVFGTMIIVHLMVSVILVRFLIFIHQPVVVRLFTSVWNISIFILIPFKIFFIFPRNPIVFRRVVKLFVVMLFVFVFSRFIIWSAFLNSITRGNLFYSLTLFLIIRDMFIDMFQVSSIIVFVIP